MRIAHIQGDQITVGYCTVLFPNTSFPPHGPNAEWMAQNNCMPVIDDMQCDPKTEKVVVVDPYVLGDSVAIVRVEPKTQEEFDTSTVREAGKVRYDRNQRLTKSDWTQLADSPVDKAAWAVYRQALRDVTAQSGFPWAVTWPTEPV